VVLRSTARYNFTYKEFIILDLSCNLSQQEAKYDFNTLDQQYFNQTYKSEINISFLKNNSFNTSYALNKHLNPMGGGGRSGGMRMIIQN